MLIRCDVLFSADILRYDVRASTDTCMLRYDVRASTDTCMLRYDVRVSTDTCMLRYDVRASTDTCMLRYDVRASTDTCMLRYDVRPRIHVCRACMLRYDARPRIYCAVLSGIYLYIILLLSVFRLRRTGYSRTHVDRRTIFRHFPWTHVRDKAYFSG